MITINPVNYNKRFSEDKDARLGNMFFQIASVIGIAVKNGYSYGFKPWVNQNYFKKALPGVDEKIRYGYYKNRSTYKGYDLGFCGFNVPDNVVLDGYFGSYKYFDHCREVIREFLSLKPVCKELKDCIIIQYRNYKKESDDFYPLGRDYYERALEELPDKKLYVITNDIKAAKEELKFKCEYLSESPLRDFYRLTQADYIVMANSTFSWWGAFLSQAETVAPKYWFDPCGNFGDCPVGNEDVYLPEWVQV